MYANRGTLQGPLGSAQSLTSAANIAKFLAQEKMDALQVAFEVTTLTSSTSSIVVTVYNRTSPGVSTNQVTLGTLTIPTAVAVGTVYYKNIEGVIAPGSTVEFDVTTQASSAGAGYCMVKGSFSSEDERNVSAYVASA